MITKFNDKKKKDTYNWIIQNSKDIILTEEDKEITGYDSKTLFTVNDIQMNETNREKLLEIMGGYVNKIKYLYINKNYEDDDNININIIIAKLYDGNYLYISQKSSLTFLNTFDFKVSPNWSHLWNHILSNDERQFLLQYNKYPNIFRFNPPTFDESDSD
jgi:hypothetical protein